MDKWEPTAATAVVGIATYQLWSAWNNSAPSLAELRQAHPSDVSVRQKLLDANLTVGTLAVVIGVTLTVLTKDLTALVIMLVFFGALSVWHNAVLDAAPR